MDFKIISKTSFGFFCNGNELMYFNKNNNTASLKVKTTTNKNFILDLQTWDANQMSWIQSSEDTNASNLVYRLNNLTPNNSYNISVDGKSIKTLKSNTNGSLMFNNYTGNKPIKIVLSSAEAQ